MVIYVSLVFREAPFLWHSQIFNIENLLKKTSTRGFVSLFLSIHNVVFDVFNCSTLGFVSNVKCTTNKMYIIIIHPSIHPSQEVQKILI